MAGVHNPAVSEPGDPTATIRPDAPDVTTADVAGWAGRLFGIEAEVRPLAGYADRNFLLRAADGTSWVLKLANRAETRETLELQNAVLDRLTGTMPAEAIPRVRPSLAGRGLEQVEIDGVRAHVRVVSFLEGELLAGRDDASERTWRSLGDLLGRVARGLEGFDHPARAREELTWNLGSASWTVGRSDLFPPDRRALVQRHQLQFLGHVQRRLAELPHGQVHGDANEHNLLVRPTEAGPEVVGLIDFGDTAWTARVFELAIAGAYAVLDREDPVPVLAELVQGYHAHVPLEPVELEALFPALCMRLVVSVTSSTLAARVDPDDPYVTVSQAAAWRALEAFEDVSPVRVAAALLAACGHAPLQPDARTHASRSEIAAVRSRSLGPSLSLSYREPLWIERGRGAFLFDEEDRAHLDGVNNVCHVGHAHPHVVEAATRQIARLNTNTRYLHPNLVRYAERLTALLPDPLEVCFFVNSGSEANELALRLVRAATGRRDVVAVEHGYHGNTSSLIDLSHYKHAGPGGRGAPEWVHLVACPDTYRGRHREDDPDPGRAYADHVRLAIESARADGREVAAFLAEPLIGCGGQIVPPEGWLRRSYDHARAAGALCIADEVQVGFGRVGTHWWAFEEQGAVPDVVTLGKPIGNGHPLAAVVTTRAIADAFDDGMEFFSTFGGNPVSCAVGLAVLDVIEGEGLLERARVVGDRLLDGLRGLAERHSVIGDVRGRGLYLGVELVEDRATRAPAAGVLEGVIEHCRDVGCLLSSDGPDHNVLKIKPPLAITITDAELLLDVLDGALASL